MNGMFDSCSSLTSINLSNFNTTNVTDMRCMFKNCKSLISLDITDFICEKIKRTFYLEEMFIGCSSLKVKAIKH